MTIFPRRAGGLEVAAINPPNDFWGEIVWRDRRGRIERRSGASCSPDRLDLISQ